MKVTMVDSYKMLSIKRAMESRVNICSCLYVIAIIKINELKFIIIK